MMDVSVEALSIFVVLMPGFVTTIILNILIVRPKQDSHRTLIEALVFSFLIYSIVGTFCSGAFVSVVATRLGATTEYRADPNMAALALATGSSILLALLLGLAATHDLHMRFFRFIRVTTRTSRPTAWLDVFSEQRRHVIVHLADGNRVRGWPQYYSDNPEEGLVYLYRPSWITRNNVIQPMTGIHGLFIVKADYINSIAFEDDAPEHQEPKEK
jgi:Family of unknown function (DUF6338)